jgi:hypothetical protein
LQRLRERVDELGRYLEQFLFERDLGRRIFDGRLVDGESRGRRVWARGCVVGRVFGVSPLLSCVYKKTIGGKARRKLAANHRIVARRSSGGRFAAFLTNATIR